MKEFDRILQKVLPAQDKILNHQVYKEIENLDDLNLFLEYHVFFVWDQMSSLKAMQKDLTCMNVPWVPKRSPQTRKYINELVLNAEGNDLISETVLSEYESYLELMRESDADSSSIERLEKSINRGENFKDLLDHLDMPKVVKSYLDFTYKTIESKDAHKIAANFVFGKQSLIPHRLVKLLNELNKKFPVDLSLQIKYFESKVMKETGKIEDVAKKIFEELCGHDEEKWDDVAEVAERTLERRLQLWDDIKNAILNQRNMATAV
jgi:hypothetical protein